MMFVNRGFCAAHNSLDITSTNVANINLIILQNAIFDEIHITKNVAFENDNTITTEWNHDTILHAFFENNLNGGNFEYTAEQVSSIRIKRRRKNTYQWITIFEIPIETYEDFIFERFDRFARNNVEYEYSFVPVTNNIEGNINANSIISKFEGVFIMEKEEAFGAILEALVSNIQKNKPTSVVTTLGSKFPYVVSNGEADYYSGSVTAAFIEYDEIKCQWKYAAGFEYRDKLMTFLDNKKPKFLKSDDGRAWIIKVISSPAEATNGDPDYISTTFNFVQIGDVESSNDLYDNNLIDINIEGV